MPPQSILDKSKDLGNYDKYLLLRDCFLAGLLTSGLTKEKYDTTLLFVLARVMMAQPQWPANNHASLQYCSKRMSVGKWRTQDLAKEGGHPQPPQAKGVWEPELAPEHSTKGDQAFIRKGGLKV